MKSKWLSRKFLMAVVGGLVVIINALLEANGKRPMDTDAIMTFAAVVISYIAVEGYIDVRSLK